jgi:hypothetical protein
MNGKVVGFVEPNKRKEEKVRENWKIKKVIETVTREKRKKLVQNLKLTLCLRVLSNGVLFFFLYF